MLPETLPYSRVFGINTSQKSSCKCLIVLNKTISSSKLISNLEFPAANSNACFVVSRALTKKGFLTKL